MGYKVLRRKIIMSSTNLTAAVLSGTAEEDYSSGMHGKRVSEDELSG